MADPATLKLIQSIAFVAARDRMSIGILLMHVKSAGHCAGDYVTIRDDDWNVKGALVTASEEEA